MKNALITGGSGEIGRAICKRLAADGLHVIVHANNNLAKAEEVVAEIKQAGGHAEALQFDVTNADVCRATLEKWVEANGAIQIIINNAGITDDAVMPGMKEAQWKSVIDVSLNGFFNVTQPLLMPMIRTRYGRIISITSIAGVAGNRGQTNYAAAKAGVHGATKSLAIEVASRGITVNAVAPGIIASAMSDAVFDKTMIDQIVPMKRAGTPKEVAALVGFLASESASYISGQVISINGGMI
ncbi:3-oxoacyl-ACP reductase FabG [Nostoc sp.]|uniref:3-oxoacyl-ACP reductase FabG n=1 Tax=Nostoc sp. TaxID=1180 RepID=UPI002FF7D110